MADLIQTPAASGIIPPDPQSGLRSLAGILGIQRQRQELQQGAAAIETAQAGAQGAQQTMQERQLLQQTMKTGIRPDTGKSIYNAKNEVDPDEVADFATKNLPLTGQAVVQNILKTKADKVALSSATADLGDKFNNDLSGRIRSFINVPGATSDTVNASLQGYAKQNPEAASAVLAASNLVKHIDNAPDMKTKNDMLLHLAQQFQPAESTASQQAPQVSTMQGPKGLQPIQTNPLAPGGVGPTGPSLPQGLAPTEKIPYKAAAAGAGARGAGTGNADVDRANQVSGSVQASSAAIPLTKHIDDLADQIHSGKFAASISKAAAAVGMSEETYARQVLEKELGQVKTLAIANAGSDARAATIQSGYPEATSDNQTIHTAMDYTRGTFRQNVARGDLLNAVKSKDPSLSGFQHADDLLTSATDPLMHEFKSLKTPAERIGFYKRNFTDPQRAQEFKEKVSGMNHVFGP